MEEQIPVKFIITAATVQSFSFLNPGQIWLWSAKWLGILWRITQSITCKKCHLHPILFTENVAIRNVTYNKVYFAKLNLHEMLLLENVLDSLHNVMDPN